MRPFPKRTYTNLRDAVADLRFLRRRRRDIRRLFKGKMGISRAFRERIMLAVTHVNGCRYCSYAHTHEALKRGMREGEIRALLNGELGDVPERELPAVLYAQHHAETRGVPDADARRRFEAAYSLEEVQAIDLTLRVILAGNYWGNLLDLVLFRLSFGRLGA